MWQIEFYTTENGIKPAKEFIYNELSGKLKAKALTYLDLLATHGNELREPYTKVLRNGILELRLQAANDIARVLYFFCVGHKIIFTNGFIKKTQKTPKDEIEKALNSKKDFERRLKK